MHRPSAAENKVKKVLRNRNNRRIVRALRPRGRFFIIPIPSLFTS